MHNIISWVNSILFFIILFIFFLSSCNTPAEDSDMDINDFVQIFDGKTLQDWEGDQTYWRVENGNLVGEVTPATLLDRNSFIIWRGGETKDFELKAEFRVSDKGNSGINYRSEEVNDVPFALRGYQSDIDGEKKYTGMNYEERGRTVLAWPGQKVLLEPVDKDSIQAYVENNQWTA